MLLYQWKKNDISRRRKTPKKFLVDTIVDCCGWNKQLILLSAFRWSKRIVRSSMIIEKINHWSGGMQIQTTKWLAWPWMIIDGTNNWSREMYIHKTKRKISHWMIIDETNDWSFYIYQHKWKWLIWSCMKFFRKKTSDHDARIALIPNESEDHA